MTLYTTLLHELKKRRFLIKKKSRNTGEWEVNLALWRLEANPRNHAFVNQIEKATVFLDTLSDFEVTLKFRIYCIFNNITEILLCDFCKTNHRMTHTLLHKKMSMTCRSKDCIQKARVRSHGGPLAAGPHVITEDGKKRMTAAGKKRKGLRKGKTFDEIFGTEKAKRFREKLSKSSSLNAGGFFSKHRKTITNPFFKDSKILIMSSYEEKYVKESVKHKLPFKKYAGRIQYLHPKNNEFRYYNPDFVIQRFKMTYIVEVKPSGFLTKNENEYNVVNRAKITALHEFCKREGKIALLCTEHELKDFSSFKELVKSKTSNVDLYLSA